jgi:hypothetical protein
MLGEDSRHALQVVFACPDGEHDAVVGEVGDARIVRGVRSVNTLA